MREHLAHDIRQRLASKRGERDPAHTGGGVRRSPATLGDIDASSSGKCVKTWVDHAGQPAAIAASRATAAARRRARRARRSRASTRWSAPRSCRRAAPWRAACAAAHDRLRAARRTPRRGAARPPPSAPCAETSLRSPRARAAQASIHGQSTQAGFFGVQMVAPRSIIACAKSPARGVAASAPRRGARMSALAAGNSLLDGEQPRHHPLDIAVDRRGRRVERNRRDRRRGIGADAGQRAQAPPRLCGKRPPWRSTTALAQACRLRARA